MSNEPTIVVRSSYERVVQVAPYETARASVFVEENFPGTLTAEEVATIAGAQFISAKAQVFTQLGLDFAHDDETGVINEIRKVFPGSEVIEAKSTPKPPAGKLAGKRPLKPVEPPEEDESYDDAEEEDNEPQRPSRAVSRPSAGRQGPGAGTAPRSASRPTNNRPNSTKPNNGNDRWWRDLMDNPDDWEVVESDNPKAPDFRHLTEKDGKFRLSLWLNNAPAWFVNPFED